MPTSNLSRQDEQRALALCGQAQQAFQSGQPAAAARLLEQALAITPLISNAHLLLAQCCFNLGRIRAGLRAAMDECAYYPANTPAAMQVFLALDALRSGKFLGMINFEQKKPPPDWPPISVCMIVKNEAENLPSALATLQDLAAELVVVDTGSQDQTVDIARAAGAKVSFFPWIDDFAAARNAALEQATHDWVFIFDGDDRLLPVDVIRLKWAARQARANVYLCDTVAPLDSAGIGVKRAQTIRLFKRRPGLHYENALHETVIPSAIRLGYSWAATNIQLQHTGYEAGEEVLQSKKRRNLAILERSLAVQPDNYYSRLVHGILQMELDREAEGIAELDETIKNLPDNFFPGQFLGTAHILLASHYARSGNLERLREVLDNGLVDMSTNHNYWVYAGKYFLQLLNDPQRALALFNRACLLPITPLDDYFFAAGLAAQLKSSGNLAALMVQASFRLGRLEQARRIFMEILAEGGRQPDPLAERQAAETAAAQNKIGEAAFHLLTALLFSPARPGELDQLQAWEKVME